MLKQVIGIILIISSIFDALKYVWQAQAIIKVKVAKGHSRKFLNAALVNTIVKLLYSLVIGDCFIFISSFLALATILYNFYILYLYYPYKGRNLLHFKRPSLLTYFINSLLPNKRRRRL